MKNKKGFSHHFGTMVKKVSNKQSDDARDMFILRALYFLTG